MNDMVLTIPEIILRLGIAMLFGGAIGFERQYKNRPAGMRTHILVKRCFSVSTACWNDPFR